MNYSLEAEQGVLGCILRGQLAPDESGLQQHHFGSALYGMIFGAAIELTERGKNVDLITLTDAIEEDYADDLVELSEAGIGIPQDMGKDYAHIVLERWQKRQLQSLAADVWQNAQEWSVDESVSTLEAAGDVLASESGDMSPSSSKLFREFVSAVDERIHSGEEITGISSGYADIDRMTGGWQKSDLIILGARPSMGKTALSINFLRHAVSRGAKAAYFSIEMPRTKMMTRFVAAEGKVPLDALKTGRNMDTHLQAMSAAVVAHNNSEFRIDDRSHMTPSLMRAACRQYKREMGGLDLVFVDYLQLMSPGKKMESETHTVSEISKQLKRLAKDFECPVIALAQLNRGLESRNNKRPTNADLRQSGQIEQDADVIMFLYRDEVYDKNSDRKGEAEVIFTKQRDGEIGTRGLAWFGATQRFDNLAREQSYE